MRYFDLHCDTLCKCADEHQPIEKNSFEVDTDRLSKYETPVQVFAAFIHDDYTGKAATDRFYQLYEIFNNSDFGNVKPILSIENLSCLNGDIDNINRFKECSVKIASLVWNGANCVAGGANSDIGLSSFGRDAVKKLESVDITIDVSHLNEKSFYELAKIATKPIVATHSNSKSICNHKRNLTDEQFKIIRDMGGIVGINLYPLFIGERLDDYGDILKHIEHFLNLSGENTLALGTDFDGADMDDRFGGVQDMAKFYQRLSNYFSKQIADKIYFENANNFFQIF